MVVTLSLSQLKPLRIKSWCPTTKRLLQVVKRTWQKVSFKSKDMNTLVTLKHQTSKTNQSKLLLLKELRKKVTKVNLWFNQNCQLTQERLVLKELKNQAMKVNLWFSQNCQPTQERLVSKGPKKRVTKVKP